MAPKKGSGKAKVPKNESEEERAARLEMEALAGEERQRREQELARMALRDRQIREQKYAHINGIKIHNQWRKIMRMAKVEELRKQIEVLSQNHEREVDRQDAVIQMLDRDMEEAEEQYALAARTHLQVVERLLELQYQRMRALDTQFGTDLQALQDEFDTERAEISNSHARKRKDMADMAAAMEREFAEAEAEARQEFEAQREEIRNKNAEEYNVQKLSLETAIDELEQKIHAALHDYNSQTDHRRATFKTLSSNDGAAAKVIEQRMKKLIHLQESIAHWRAKLASSAKEWEDRNKALKAEKEIMTKHYAALKAAMDTSRAQQAERLRALSVASSRVLEALRAKLARGESILKLAELCRKYETEGEQVLPFYSSAEAAQAEAMEAQANASEARQGELAASRPALHSRAVDAQACEVPEADYLARFFVRYNRVLLDQAAVDREKARLQQQNEQLRARLKQYLDGLSVSPQVLDDPANPLLIINQRLQMKLAAQAAQKQAAAKQAARTQQPVLVLVNATGQA